MRLAGAGLKKALIDKGIAPKMGWSHGELEIKVNGQRVYSYKQEHPMPAQAVLLQRIENALAK